MKRESGGSPEQSRCCKFHAEAAPLFGHWLFGSREGRAAGTSQKTCHTIGFFTAFEEKAEE